MPETRCSPTRHGNKGLCKPNGVSGGQGRESVRLGDGTQMVMINFTSTLPLPFGLLRASKTKVEVKEMKRTLSFGGGVQTTALAILAKQGYVKFDEAVFADTKAEKPETYEYMEAYTIPLFKEIGVGFSWLYNTSKYDGDDLYEYSWKHQFLPGIPTRQCSYHFKARVIHKAFPDTIKLIGFSTNEARRAENPIHADAAFPLLGLGLSGAGCSDIISSYGWPLPTKSSCFFCPFQRPYEWNWIKMKHPELFERALALEAHMYEKHPRKRNLYGLFGGKPLWKFAEGIQQSFDLQENSCWEGHCGH